ncbi:hypothetical protein HK098_007790, partial [Nowakowskiella sp. JEL0407]
CCSLPPIKTDDYTPLGEWKELAGMKTYVTGHNSKKVIVGIYDIFGYYPQVLQGADLLASQGYKVVIPDFFRGNPYPADKFPLYSSPIKHGVPPEEYGIQYFLSNTSRIDFFAFSMEKFVNFLGDIGNFEKRQVDLVAIANELRQDGAEKIGLYGLCWGGKVAILAGSGQNGYDAVAQMHPARMNPEDALNLIIPVATFISEDEPVEVFNKFVEIANTKDFKEFNSFGQYRDMHHGFGGSRANLKDPRNAEAFNDVYSKVADFFKKALY